MFITWISFYNKIATFIINSYLCTTSWKETKKIAIVLNIKYQKKSILEMKWLLIIR